MSIEFDIIAPNGPNNLPSAEEIIQQCMARALANSTNPIPDIYGLPLVDESKDGTPCAWVKFASYAIMAEARTQDYVARVVNGNPDAPVRVPYVYLSFRSGGWGYIVMEYIDGENCRDRDVKLVAPAVKFLVNVKAPTAQLGPIGGGPIRHDFFIDSEASLTYSSVAMLEKHINGILKYVGMPNGVNLLSLGPEVEEHGLRLCLSDLIESNFMKDRNGTIVAVDFGEACFLPVSFFDLSLCNHRYFTQLLKAKIRRPESNQLNALRTASFSLVPFGTDKIGVPSELKKTVK